MSSSEFCHFILQVLSDESLRTEFSKKSLASAREFDLKITAGRTLEIYRQVVGT